MTYSLYIGHNKQTDELSYIGGIPRLPPGESIPVCKLCGSLETFMFQIAFPNRTNWAGRTLSMFFCTCCAGEQYLLPEMLPSSLYNVIIPNKFLTDYQRNFSIIVFNSDEGIPVDTYKEKVAFTSIEMRTDEYPGDFGVLGGLPKWALQDESPSTYENNHMVFLMQIAPNFKFIRTDSSPPQIELDLMGNPAPSPLDYYQLFLGNTLYLFGSTGNSPMVYAITQV